jgi:predicted DCC family thiol-disulfide oxidoreductase YuxK
MPPSAETNEQGAGLDGLMLFDGHCHMCSATVQAVLVADRKSRIRFAPVQSELGRRLMGDRGLDPDDPASFIFFDQGVALTKSAAMLAMAKRFPWPWRAVQAE